MAEKSVPSPDQTPVDEPIDVQRRAVREAVQRRLRVVHEPPPADVPRRRSSRKPRHYPGDLSCDLAFNPLIDSKW